MKGQRQEYSFQSICDMISNFASCMDDYLYVYDVNNDAYFISERAVERFAIPCNYFHDVQECHRRFVYPDDYNMLKADLEAVSRGEKQEHNLQYRWLGRDGEPIWINCRGRVLTDGNGKPAFMIGCINEIGALQKADNISGLLGEISLRSYMENFGKRSVQGFVLRVGIDDYDDLNEKFGVEYGDFILRTVANCINAHLNLHQRAYRLVADEILVADFTGSDGTVAKKLYEDIRTGLDHIIEANHYEAVYTISAGIVDSHTVEVQGYDELMKFSQFALREAREKGKNRAYQFDVKDYRGFLRKRELLRTFRESVASGFAGFDLRFQPIVDAVSGRIYAAEALLRYTDKNGEPLSPLEAIPILEDSGLIIPVGKWVIKKALSMCNECRKIYSDFKVSVNLSYIQILKSPLMTEINRLLEEANIGCEGVIMELTESGYLDETPTVRNVWNEMRDLGIDIAVDDFGTGYSNLMNIGKLKPNIVKLDRQFTLKALTQPYEYQLMEHVIRMVHNLGLCVCIEGIEKKEELDKICKLSPDYIQGYYYGKPCSAQEFMKKLWAAADK